MTTSFDLSFASGTVLTGKWNKNSYLIERLLGEGANGKVYLVRQGRRQYALKLGFDSLEHQSEVNALKVLSGTSTSFQHVWVETDDLEWNGMIYPFSVMRYIKGQSLTDFLRDKGFDWTYLIGLNLLRKLAELHASGYAFCDLKAENMRVTEYGEVELIDFGGVTAKGRSVKQFTEVFDRGYWGAGTRVASDSYDLFSFAALLLSVTDKERRFTQAVSMLPQNRNADVLLDMLATNRQLSAVEPVLRKALTGRYETSKQAVADWRARSLKSGRPMRRKAAGSSWITVCFAASLVLFAAALYYSFA
ncbi:serine/threonine protein kinase [Paenibacillus sp. UNCCL117]|uniref:protein kinase domain-containing protein n=1 Tax=unclassified Paenibacillus TaxID=185978 RepID=UPI0008895E35|nr:MULTISPECIES: phosphotransferase [unclassified Paenibacillus]SDE54173.1 serine/threonine protein kinase [Paenibacillus sp. cl123]SFW68152.1 serine/threonine protein kinase [Paenibacillus sp. UNCCL117]